MTKAMTRLRRFYPRRVRRKWSVRPVMEPVERRLLLSAVDLTVDSTGGGASGMGTSGTLPYVLSLANANAITYAKSYNDIEIGFDPVIFSSSSPQTISLDAPLTLSETTLPVVINGPGAGVLSISGAPASSVFDVASGVTATISGLTVTGGSASYRGGGVNNYGNLYLYGCTIEGNSAGGVGGGLSNDKGMATLTDCTLSGNSAHNFGGAIVNDSGTIKLTDCPISDNGSQGNGAALSNAGTATLMGCTVSGNTVGPQGGGGGGVENFNTLTLTGCTISYNSSGDDNDTYGFGGGGLRNAGTAILTDCTISGNSAYVGGGLENFSYAKLSECTLSYNSSGGGGGLDNFDTVVLTGCTISGNSAPNGAGVFNDTGTATLSDCTMYGNDASIRGGGLTLDTGTATITDCTISGNTAGNNIGGGLDIVHPYDTAIVTDTIIAGNFGSSGSANDINNYNSPMTSSHDLIGKGGAGGITNGTDGNIVLTSLDDLELGPLADNGGPTADNVGPTETMALLPGSVAIGAGVAADGVTTDQRGVARPTANPDTGAFQTVEPSPATEPATSITSTTATLHATVNPEGSETSAWFVYSSADPTLAADTTTTPSQDIGEGVSALAVNAPLTGLTPDTTYYYTIIASNAAGTTSDTVFSFKTAPVPAPPVAATQPATAVTAASATLNASVNPERSATNVEFVYGTSPTLSTGTMTTATQSIGNGTSAVAVSAGLTNLTPGTTYYYRAVALSAGGITDGTILSFTTARIPTPTPSSTSTTSQSTPTQSPTSTTIQSKHRRHKPHAARPTHGSKPHASQPTHHSHPHPHHRSHHHPSGPAPTPTPSPGSTAPGSTGTSPAPAASYTVDISGNFIDGPFGGSLDETFTLDASAGSDLADAIASYLTNEYTGQAAQLSTELKPGEEMAPTPRIVTVENVADNSGIVTGSFICQGGSGLTTYQYTGGFTAGVTT